MIDVRMPSRIAPTLSVLLLGLIGCASATPRPSAQEVRAVAILRERHVDGARIGRGEVDLVRAIAALGDPWTRVYTAAQAAQLMAEVSGTARTGVGLPELLSIDLDAAGRHLEIVAPLPDSAAARAGLQPHDRVAAIDRRPVDASRYAEAMAALRVPAGQRVALTIERGGAARDVVLVAAPIAPASPVSGARQGDTLVVRLAAFGADSASAFADLLAAEQPASLELDLRGHTGGRVNAVLAIAGMIAGEITMAEMVGPGGARTPLTAVAAPAPFAGPLVVRVDGGTASGAELLASGLRHARRARIVGTRTFGKCLVHQGEPLPGGRLLFMTTGRLAEPGSQPWCGRGLRPGS